MIVLSIIHLVLTKKPRTLYNVCRIFLLYFLIGVGLSSLNAYLLHVFYAYNIGKASANLFQYQLGMAYLGIGILGILCIFIRGNFWLATIIMNTVFNWGVAFRYLSLMIQTHQYQLGGVGLLFDLYILIPLITVVLYIIMRKQKPSV
jgi:hypothetical protein